MPTVIKELARLVGETPKQRFVLRLYVTGTTRQSGRAIANINALCESRLKGRYTLEVVDLYQNRGEAKAHDIVVAPTLVKQLPLPLRRLIGDMSNTHHVLLALGLEAETASGGNPPPAASAAATVTRRARRPRALE